MAVLPAVSAIFLVYWFITVRSHFLFNFFDAAGFACAESKEPIVHLALKEVRKLDFHANEQCQTTKVTLDENGTCVVQFDSTDSFRDGSIDASRGFTSLEVPQPSDRLRKVVMLPLRREWPLTEMASSSFSSIKQ
jgi:hypothetical protein